MKLHRAIEKIASVSRVDWVSIESCDLSKKLAEDLERARFAETRWEYPRGGRREMFVRLTDAGRDGAPEIVDPVRAPDVPPAGMGDVFEPEPPVYEPPTIEFHEDDRGSLRMGPPPRHPEDGHQPDECPDGSCVVVEIVEALRHGDLDTHPIVVDMQVSRVIADAIWKRWGKR